MAYQKLQKVTPDLVRDTHLMVVHGSRAYGMHGPSSDVDIKGFMIPPVAARFATYKPLDQVDGKDKDMIRLLGPEPMMVFYDLFTDEEKEAIDREKLEGTIYEFSKFIMLLQKMNPSMIDILYCRDAEVRVCTEIGEYLRSQRKAFLSQMARGSYVGYAEDQMAKLKAHRGWLLNPPSAPPTREEFNLPSKKEMSRDKVGAIWKAVEQYIEENDCSEEEAFTVIGLRRAMDMFHRERQYQRKRQEWSSYQNWKKHRNRDRAKIEEVTGYDCYSADTEFLTDRGWLFFDDIKDEDRLATVFLGSTELRHQFSVEYQAPTHRFDADYRGPMIRMSGHHIDARVTPNHRMLIRKVERNTGSEYSWKLDEAGNLPDCFDILSFPSPKKRNFKNPDILSSTTLTPENLLRLMGWYLSDGSLAKKGKEVRVSQKKGGKLHWSMSRFSSSHDKCSLYEYPRKADGFRREPGTEMVLSVRHSDVAALFAKECGQTKDKRIPRWVFGLSKRHMEILLDAMSLGDGTKREHGTVYYSSLRTLAGDVQELALMCGFHTSMYGPYGPYEEDSNTEMYQVWFCKEREQFRRLVRYKNTDVIPDCEERVVCFSVPNGTLITRRNGQVAIHGNCKHASHLYRLMKMGYEIVTKGEIKVWRDDADEILAIREGAWEYEQLHEWFFRARQEILSLDMSQSPLPEKPDTDRTDEIFATVFQMKYGFDPRDR